MSPATEVYWSLFLRLNHRGGNNRRLLQAKTGMLTMRGRIIIWPAVHFIENSLWSGSRHLPYIPAGGSSCDCHSNGDNINCHCSHPIQSVSGSDGGSAPRDDLYSPEHQRRPGHLDEPQRLIPSEDLVT